MVKDALTSKNKLDFWQGRIGAEDRADRVRGWLYRHCERSEAIQNF
jgi:hypothetical protein